MRLSAAAPVTRLFTGRRPLKVAIGVGHGASRSGPTSGLPWPGTLDCGVLGGTAPYFHDTTQPWVEQWAGTAPCYRDTTLPWTDQWARTAPYYYATTQPWVEQWADTTL